jgi:hypothetical protein
VKGAPSARRVFRENRGLEDSKETPEIQADPKDRREPRVQPGLKGPLEPAVKRATPVRRAPRESRVKPESEDYWVQRVLRGPKENRE